MTPTPRSAAFQWRDRYALYVALLVAWVAMLGSLYFSEVRHFVPCTWCWYQRILIYPQALVVLPLGLLLRDERLPYYTLAFSLVGIIASSYHYMLQKTTWFLGGAACALGVPCNTIYVNYFGFVTIPFMALVASLLIFAATVLVLTGEGWLWDEEDSPPWRPVVAIIGAVMLAFLPLWLTGETAATPAPSTSAAPITTTLPDGATLYREACAGCHGPAGEGVVGLAPPLTDGPFTAQSSAELWLAMVRAGRAADHPENTSGLTMPPSGGRPDLTNDELLAIRDYLRLLDEP